MLLVRHPPSHPAERAWVLDVVLGRWLGLEYEAHAEERGDVEIVAAGEEEGVRVPEGLFATPPQAWLTEASMPRRLAPREGLADVFGTVFFMLTRYEELVRPERDAHGRFPSSATLAHAEGLLQRPVADERAEALWEALKARWPRLERRPPRYRVVLSHDVDWPLAGGSRLRAAAGDVVRRRDPGLALARLRGRNVNDTFDFLMDHSERRGLASAFYFMAGRTNPEWDGGYSLDDPWIAGLLRRVDDRGHEIGLHPSYETFRDPGALRAEHARLLAACEAAGVRQRPRGGRQHFLRWENPATWRAWAQAGLEYDASLGFSDVAGFRCGTSREYPAFDLRARRPLGLVERPLVVMEQAVMGERTPPEEVARAVARLAEPCRRLGGDLSLLWHNSSLVTARERRAYAAALDAAANGAGAAG
jgi:uncharacterized protein DUF7033